MEKHNKKVKAKIIAFSIAMIGSLAVGDEFIFLADKSFNKILYRVTCKTYRAMYIIQVGDDVETPTPVPISIAVMKMPGNWKWRG